jgi:crossover junction endodeoxyribonuclease RuvC
MKVIAIDPGYERLGIAVLERAQGRQKDIVLYSGCLTTPKTDIHSKRLLSIKNRVEELIEHYQPEAFATESLFFSKNQKTALAVAEVRGVILCLAEEKNLEIKEFLPTHIKIAVTGHGASDKKQIAKLLPALVTLAHEPKLDDEYDAIAIAITFFAHQRNYLKTK